MSAMYGMSASEQEALLACRDYVRAINVDPFVTADERFQLISTAVMGLPRAAQEFVSKCASDLSEGKQEQ